MLQVHLGPIVWYMFNFFSELWYKFFFSMMSLVVCLLCVHQCGILLSLSLSLSHWRFFSHTTIPTTLPLPQSPQIPSQFPSPPDPFPLCFPSENRRSPRANNQTQQDFFRLTPNSKGLLNISVMVLGHMDATVKKDILGRRRNHW